MRMLRVVLICFMLVLVVVNAQAATSSKKNQPYIGGKLGLMIPDSGRLDDAFNLGVSLGLTLNELQAGSIAMEGELTTTIIDGDIDGGGDWDVTTLAGYGVFRTNGPIYFKGKAGLAYWDASYDDDVSLSIGVGGGYRISDKSALELEYTVLDSDLDFFSLGFKMNLL